MVWFWLLSFLTATRPGTGGTLGVVCMAVVFAVTNQKGGVGKTTVCASVCGAIANMGKSVLAIDLDPQGNLGFSLGADCGAKKYTAYDVLKGEVEIYNAIQHTKWCDVVPSNILLSGCELELNSMGREYILKDQIKDIASDYEYIFIDTPPSLSILTINAYTAADQLIIPMMAEILSIQGITQLKETIFAVKKYYNKDLQVRGIVLNRYNARYRLTHDVEDLAQLIAEKMDTDVLETKITQSIQIAEAPAHAEPIVNYAPLSRAAEEFISLTYEIIREDKPKKSLFKRGRGRPRKYPNVG